MSYAKINEVTIGTRVKVDGGFTCMSEGEEHIVQRDDHGLYIPCSRGKHYLDGQIERYERGFDQGHHYIGLIIS